MIEKVQVPKKGCKLTLVFFVKLHMYISYLKDVFKNTRVPNYWLRLRDDDSFDFEIFSQSLQK